MSKKKQTPAESNPANPETGVVPVAPAKRDYFLQSAGEGIPGPDLSGFKQLTMPIIRPGEMPVGSWIQGTIAEIVPSRSKEFKRPLLKLSIEGKGDCLFPMTAVVARNLAGETDLPQDEMIDKASAHVGAEIVIIKTGTKESDGKRKKPTHLFDIRLKPANSKR